MKKITLTLLVLAVCFMNSLAQPNTWSSRGIGAGGAIQNPAISPQNSLNAYVTCDMGQTFNSNNGGNSWQIIDFNKLNGGIYGKVCYTSNANKLYAITSSSAGYGLKHSIDGGANWSTLPTSPALTNPLSLYTDLTSSLNLVVSDINNIYYSSNGGSNLTLVATDPSTTGIHCAGVFFDLPNIYICSNKALYVSVNSGNTFSTLATHTAAAISATEGVVCFTGAKQGGTTKFFCTTIQSASLTCRTFGSDVGLFSGVYEMTQPMPTWNSITASLLSCNTGTERAYYIRTLPTNTTVVYIGGNITTTAGSTYGNIYKSQNSGATWTSNFLDGASAANNSVIATGWCGSSSYSLYPHDWKAINTTEGLCIDPNNINHLIRTDKSASYKSTDGGATWRQTYVDVPDQNNLNTLINYTNAYKGIGLETTVAYWMTWMSPQKLLTSYADISLSISNDGGNKFLYKYDPTNVRSNPLKINDISMIVKHPKTGKLYAATGDVVGSNGTWDDTRLSLSKGRVCMSSDSGATWQIMKDFGKPVTYIEIDPARPDTMYVCVHDVMTGTVGGIWTTTNVAAGSSSNWTVLTQPARANRRPNNIHVINKDTLIASYYPLDSLNTSQTAFAQQSGVFYSVDRGQTWQDRTGTGMGYGVLNIVPDRNDPFKRTWLACVRSAGSGTAGVYRTINRGNTWFNAATNISPVSVSFHPTLANEMYVCTEFSGLLYSNASNSNTITTAPTNYPFRNPQRVFFNPYNSNEVWVTANGYGLCVGTTSIMTSSSNAELSMNQIEVTVYPNPVKDKLYLKSQQSIAEAHLYDLSGRMMPVEIRNNTIELPNLIDGIYLLQLKSENGQEIFKKILIMQ